jgi:hypothetical protein
MRSAMLLAALLESDNVQVCQVGTKPAGLVIFIGDVYFDIMHNTLIKTIFHNAPIVMAVDEPQKYAN